MSARALGAGMMGAALVGALARPLPDGAPCCAKVAGVLEVNTWRGWVFVAGFALVLWSAKR